MFRHLFMTVAVELNAQSYQNLIDSIKNQSKCEKSYDTTILNGGHAKNTESNTIQSQQIHQSTSSLTNPVTFNHSVYSTSTVSSCYCSCIFTTQCIIYVKSINFEGTTEYEII